MGYNEKIAVIMTNFNFKKVAKCMRLLKWEWHGEGIPSVTRLKEFSKTLLEEVAQRLECTASISCGGFCAKKNKNGVISLQFTITDWDSDGIE